MPNYSFIEIGTSDFDTLIQQCNDDDIGLSIEPLKHYLDLLPNKNGVTKINAAISNKNGNMNIYYVKPSTISALNLPWWVKGCNSIGSQHPTVCALLRDMNLDPNSIITCDNIIIKDIETVMIENNVEKIGLLKVDTEGHDCIILNNYIEYCMRYPHLFANKIIFETNCLSNADEQTQVIELLIKNGYTLLSRDTFDAVLIRNV